MLAAVAVQLCVIWWLAAAAATHAAAAATEYSEHECAFDTLWRWSERAASAFSVGLMGAAAAD